MPKLSNINSCTGCGACANSCSKDAISLMPIGRLGNLYPSIDADKCVECGKCTKCCPELQPKIKSNDEVHCYASWARDAVENEKSTSGGLASVASTYILQKGGCVFGACSKHGDVFHVRISEPQMVDLLRGSKYVQSSVMMTYRETLAELKAGRRVLYIGTPCQIAGLKAFLRKDYANLITMDIICHGTPSTKLLIDHLKGKLNRDYDSVSFREGGFILRAFDENKKVMYQEDLGKDFYSDAYYTAFMKGLSYRTSCYHCRYANKERISDLTIGDFWGLGKKVPFVSKERNHGVSVVITNTKRGQEFLQELSPLLHIYERDLEEAVAGNSQLRKPYSNSLRVRLFRLLFSHGLSLEKAVKYAMLDKKIYRQIIKCFSHE